MSIKITGGKMINLSTKEVRKILIDYAMYAIGRELVSGCDKVLYSKTEYGVAISFVNIEEESEAK